MQTKKVSCDTSSWCEENSSENKTEEETQNKAEKEYSKFLEKYKEFLDFTFNKIDTNSDEKLDELEIVRAYLLNKDKEGVKKGKNLIKENDLDGNNKIDRVEFYKWIYSSRALDKPEWIEKIKKYNQKKKD